MTFNGLVGLISRIRSAGSDDRDAVIGDSGVSGKTKSSYQMLGTGGVGYIDSSLVIEEYLMDFANSLDNSSAFDSYLPIKFILSKLGLIRTITNSEKSDLSRVQIEQLFNEIDNYVEIIENEVNEFRKRTNRVYKQKQYREINSMHKSAIYDDYEVIEKSDKND